MASSANIFRRLVSKGQKASENDDEPSMSPSPGDGTSPPPPESSNKAAGALASVFKGLTGSKQPKPHPATLAPTRATSATSADYVPGLASDSDLAPPLKAIGAGALAPSQAANLEQLKHGKSSERIAAADALRYCIADYPFNPVLEIWYAGKDLIEQDKPNNVRVAGWGLLRECVKHAGSTDLERKEYFDTLTAPTTSDDFHLQLEALIVLTKRGRDLSGFDYGMFPLMTTWLNESFKAVIKARKQRTAKSSKGKSAPTGEDTNFSQLFLFLLEVIKFSFKVADDRTIATLIKSLREICVSANVEEDLVFCINAINAIVTYGKIPSKSLPDALNILSAIFALVRHLKKEAWHALANLYKSHHGEEAVQVLLRVVRQFPPERRDPKESSREVRGALSALGKLVTKTTAKGYPQVPLGQLVDGLANASSKSASPRLLGAVLDVINCLFDVGDGQLSNMIVDEDWSPILDIAASCAGKLIDLQAQNGSGLQRRVSTATLGDDSSEKREKDPHQELRILSARIEYLLSEKRPDLAQRQACIACFVKNHRTLSDAAVDLVVDHFKEFGGCSPSEPLWEQNLGLVLSFYTDMHRITLVRLHALQLLERVFVVLEVAHDILGGDHVSSLIQRMLNGIAEETDTLLLQDTVTFMVSVAVSTTATDLFELVTSRLKSVIINGRSRKNAVSELIQSPDTTTKGERAGYCANQSPSNVVTRGYVQIFMRTMHTNAPKSLKAFTALVNIARSNQCETDARLTAMKLLFRLRADWYGHIYITPITESEGLAGVLYRTESSLARKLAEDAVQSTRPTRAEQGLNARPSRGASFGPGQPHDRSFAARMAGGSNGPASTAVVKSQQLWSLPDAEALPEAPTPSSSKLLYSCEPRNSTRTSVETSNAAKKSADSKSVDICSDQIQVLNMASWLETIGNLFLAGSDWEVYSFVLVHLPDQLSNHALFRGAISQIQDIRKLLCDQVKSNDFREPPSSAGPRRPEVLSCLYQTLTMMLSYHHHFQKSDEDDLVRTFIHGLTDKTAVICIHAITICCHEVPMSISKSLVTILQGMSRVITRQGVAMHILEFLAGLSHLTDLYSNFRDDEYRIVFSICFHYLQTVRDNNRRNARLSAPGANEPSPVLQSPAAADGASAYSKATDELPEYVFALAYHVIVFWFLALKVPDRASHVGWIASRLFTDNDGKQITDEQAQVTFDFMQRTAFAASDESIEDPMFKEMNPAELAEKTWLVGESIVTVQQVINSGLAQVIRRQPSGTSYFTIQQNFAPRPAHQVHNRSDDTDGIITLPSNLLVRLLSSTPQAWDSVHRPIPLSDGEALERTIRVFDRNSPVDGHKVGVIYIGENQTEETEILANMSGSEDYNTLLAGLGSMVILKGSTFNTHGLDREFDSDGEHAVCWRDRVTEIVFHVTTQMPTNLEHDPQCIGKKRHIGNDFVNIIFNDSGAPFDFDTFPSQFNYLNIVITPESRVSFVETHDAVSSPPSSGSSPSASTSPAKEGKAPLPCFYKVQVMTKPGFPEISPAAETKIVSLEALPHLVRLLALNASVFCLVWAGRERGQVHISPWRNRLREINRLRERFGPKLPPTSPLSAGGAGTMTGQQFQSGHPQQQQAQQQPPALNVQHPSESSVATSSRPASSVRDSFSSLRRSSVATFFTTTSEQTSHRSSVLSNATTDHTETVQPMDSVMDSLDFSKWA